MWPLISWQQVWQESPAAKPSIKAGTLRCTPNGSLWRYVQANAAIAKGDVLMKHTNDGMVAALDTDVTTAQTAAGQRRVTAAALFTAANLKGGWFLGGTDYAGKGHDYILWVDAGACQGQGGYIYNQDSASSNYVDVYCWTGVTNPGAFDTLLSVVADITVFTDTLVVKTTAAANRIPVGVAQKAVTADCFFWSLIKGRGIVHWDTSPGTTLATDDMEIQNSPDEAGAATGMTATQTTIERSVVVGRGLTLDIDADGYMPIDVDVLRNISPQNTILVSGLSAGLDYEWPYGL